MSNRQAVRKNFEEKAAYFAQALAGMTVIERGSFFAVDCGLPSDTFNVIVARDLSATEQILQNGIGYFMAKQFPVALWYWEDPAHRAGIDALLAYGLTHNETNLAMVADLQASTFNVPAPTGLIIRHVERADDLQQFGALIARLFGDSAEGPQVAAYFRGLSQQAFQQFPAMRHYIGIYQGEAVATGTLFIGSETVGIYDITTQINYRQRGIGSAMFAHLLHEAQPYLQRYAVLQASPDGIGIYQKAGFTAVGKVLVLENRALL
ncbi:MAG: GNAT family N-acetyltransferase [Chloroflexi bacterium]|nr:GNAT family N-acetyltransferase [Chloroflexota bacterium]